MATRLYFKKQTKNITGLTATKLSATLTADVSVSPFIYDMHAGPNYGSVTTASQTTLGQTASQLIYHGKFVSRCISSGDITAQTWTVALNPNESNASANMQLVPSVYVVEADGTTVRGFIIDANTAIGTEYGTAQQGILPTFSGAGVTGVIDSDRLAFEWWSKGSQGNTTARTLNQRWGGLTDPVDTVTQLDSAAYLETPQTLTFHATKSMASGG